MDLRLIGWILMGGGVLVILPIFMLRSRRARSTGVITDSLGRKAVVERDDRISGVSKRAN